MIDCALNSSVCIRSMNSIAPVCLVEPGKKIHISCLLGTMNTLVCKVSEFLDDVIDLSLVQVLKNKISSSLYFSLVVQFYQMYPRLNNKL